MNDVMESQAPPGGAVPELVLEDIVFVRDGVTILDKISWTVRRGEHWIVLGPNGCGKSSLLRIAGLLAHPSSGSVTIKGHELGTVDVRPLRAKIGTCSAALSYELRPDLLANDVVVCGATGALEPWWHTYTTTQRDRADYLLGTLGLDGYGQRRFGSLSSGERQRCLLARSLMPDPSLLLFDEPNAGLDLGGREDLVDALCDLAQQHPNLATVLVTHHVEEIPPSATHLLAMADGRSVARGDLHNTLTEQLLGKLFERNISLYQQNHRFSAIVAR